MYGARCKESCHDERSQKRLIVKEHVMPCEVSDGRGHQAAEDGEQHEPLVNGRTAPIEVCSNKQDHKHGDVEQGKCDSGQWIGPDPEITAHIETAPGHLDRNPISEHDDGCGENCRQASELAMKGQSSCPCQDCLGKKEQQPCSEDGSVGSQQTGHGP